MPHALVSEADGSFTFKPIDWDERLAGDYATIPQPSFVGNTISDLTFHRGRMVLLSGEYLIASRSEDYFNFWRTTATQLLDDDPIDISANTPKISLLNYGLPWNQTLLLFSQGTQFVLKGDPVLTPKTASIDPVTDFDSTNLAKPVSSGTAVFFATDRTASTAFREFYVADADTGVFDANNTTKHVSSYIPPGVFKIAATSSEEVMVALSAYKLNSLYVYKYYYSNGEKVQSSWSRWDFEESIKILNVEFLQSELYLTIYQEDTGDFFIDKVRMDPSAVDENLPFVMRLDRRISEAAFSSMSYNQTTDRTTVELPYAAHPDVVAYTRGGDTDLGEGLKIPIVSLSGDRKSIVLEGDRRDTKFYVGLEYKQYYRFSEFFLRDKSENGGRGSGAILTEGRLTLKYLTLVYSDSTLFDVKVTPKGRKTYTYTFTGRISGDSENTESVIAMSSGDFKVPLMSNARGLKVEIENDSPFPANLMSAAWSGQYIQRSRPV